SGDGSGRKAQSTEHLLNSSRPTDYLLASHLFTGSRFLFCFSILYAICPGLRDQVLMYLPTLIGN
ncbi:MAG: hypothetical protein LJE87_13135, partial [Deltaproteobacteria bacterium]|nr:hypothetical protein [Deltaproteobacteria bacterium]